MLTFTVDSAVHNVSIVDVSGPHCDYPDVDGSSAAHNTIFAVPGGGIRSLYLLQKQRLFEESLLEAM